MSSSTRLTAATGIRSSTAIGHGRVGPPLDQDDGPFAGAQELVFPYEGQAAIELELLAREVEAQPYPWAFGRGPELVGLVHDDLAAGRNREEIAASFHETVAAAAAAACAEATEPRTVVLSGGTFQNLRLLGSTRRRLEELGFRVLSHRRVPPNDGGISYGQAAVAARTISS